MVNNLEQNGFVSENLGETTSPLLIFGGAYGNLQATEAVLAQAKKMQIAPKNILFTGDLTAYCADPKATVNLIRQSGIKSVMGNCEEQLAGKFIRL